MTTRNPQTVPLGADSKNRVLAFSAEQEAMVAELSAKPSQGPQELEIGLPMRGMESWLALVNASTWLDLAEDQQSEFK
jgi:hypothetical protein